MITNRPGDDQRGEISAGDIDDAIVQIAEIIDDGNNPKAAVLYDILEDILAPPAKPTQPMAPIKYYHDICLKKYAHHCELYQLQEKDVLL